MKTYSEKLKDPRWQKKRLEILQRDGFRCVFCGNDEDTLHIHHIGYSNEPWDTDPKLLITLCEGCHEWESDKLKYVTFNLVNELRMHGLTANGFESMKDMFANSKVYWSRGSRIFEIFKYILNNKELWEKCCEEYNNDVDINSLF